VNSIKTGGAEKGKLGMLPSERAALAHANSAQVTNPNRR
jgi:hypothetical protein